MALTTPAQSLTLAQMIALCRQLVFDLDSTAYALTDTNWTDEINNAYQVWSESFGNRYRRLDGTAAFGSIAAQTAPGITSTSTGTTVLAWQRLFYDGATTTSATYGPELELQPVHVVIALQNDDTAQGTPKVAAVAKLSANNASDIGKWALYLYPMPDSSCYVSALAHFAPSLFMATTSDVLDCTEAESRVVATIAAGRIAERLGKSPSLIDGIWKMVPQDVQAVLNVKRRDEPEARN